jgi:hypothetical protein
VRSEGIHRWRCPSTSSEQSARSAVQVPCGGHHTTENDVTSAGDRVVRVGNASPTPEKPQVNASPQSACTTERLRVQGYWGNAFRTTATATDSRSWDLKSFPTP